MIVAIEGNIGSGKSTLIRYLNSHGAHTIIEPIDRYTNFRNKHNPLLQLYSTPKTDAAIAQLYFMDVSFDYFTKEFSKYSSTTSVFSERCFQSTLPFVYLWAKKTNFTDFVLDYILEQYLSKIVRAKKPDIRVFLDVKPQVCLKRVAKRQRLSENLITLEILQNLDKEIRKQLPESCIMLECLEEESTEEIYDKLVLKLKEHSVEVKNV